MSAPDGRQTVGRYRILGFLGAGAMGEVYLAEDPHIERKLAIKTVRLVGRPAEIEDRKKRLLREARAAGRLLHPHIVTLFDAGEADGSLFLAFELVEGTDLAGRLEAGPPLSLREVLRIVRQVAEALDYAHRQGIVHRDIKPSNILLDAAGRVKVADFGIAKVTGQSTELTVAGSVMGSPQYLSPEQIRGDDLDGRTDIFSLGVVLYELLSGKRPFEGETITTLVYQILHKEPPPASGLRMIPPRLEQLLGSLLAKDRDERVANAGLVAEELAAIERDLDDETLSAPAARADANAVTSVLPRRTGTVSPPPPAMTTHQSAPPPIPPIPPPPQANPPVRPATGRVVATDGISPKRWLPLAAAVVLIAAVAGGWLLLGRPGGDPGPSEQVAVSTAPGAQETPAPASPLPASVPVSPASPTPSPEERPDIRVQEPVEDSRSIRDPQETRETRDTPAPTPTPAPRRQPEPPLPEPRREPQPPAAPVPTPEPQRPTAEETPAAEPSTPAPAPAGPVVKTGLDLSFRVTPPDAFVLVDRTQIGRAKEWSGQKGARVYTLPGPGQYRIRIRAQGMKEHSINVEASETGGVTPIFARLSPLPAAEVETGDLRVVRVGEAVSFRVKPAGAVISVEGQVVGPAQSYNGGIGARGWLKLPAGRHRVSVSAPGHRQQDILVEVVPGFSKEREKIDIDLQGGG